MSMEIPVIDHDATVESMGLEVGDTVCYIQHWIQSDAARVSLGKVTELLCRSLVKVKWDHNEEECSQFVRHLVKLTDEEADDYVKAYRAAIEAEEARLLLASHVVPDDAHDAAEKPKPAKKPKAKAKRKPTPNSLKKSKAETPKATPKNNLKARMLQRRKK